MTTPPRGRDAIRDAVLDAAERRFAAQGLRTTLREIAADAGVNVGLVHRHLGRKDDVLRAVLERQAGAGTRLVADATDLADAVVRLFDASSAGGRYIRTLAALVLDGVPIEQLQHRFPTVEAMRALAVDDAERRRLLAAVTLVFGWATFAEPVLTMFHEPARGAVEDDLRGALRTLLRP